MTAKLKVADVTLRRLTIRTEEPIPRDLHFLFSSEYLPGEYNEKGEWTTLSMDSSEFLWLIGILALVADPSRVIYAIAVEEIPSYCEEETVRQWVPWLSRLIRDEWAYGTQAGQ